MSYKQYLTYLHFIASIKEKKKSIIFGYDYVVLSKKAYESLINLHHSEIKSFSYDEPQMNDWIKKRFLDDK